MHPVQHDLRSSVPPSGHVACHFIICVSSQSEIQDLRERRETSHWNSQAPKTCKAGGGKNSSASEKGRTIQHFHKYTSKSMLGIHDKHSKNFKKWNYTKQNKNATPWHLLKSNENIQPHKGLHTNIHSSFAQPQTGTEAKVYQQVEG